MSSDEKLEEVRLLALKWLKLAERQELEAGKHESGNLDPDSPWSRPGLTPERLRQASEVHRVCAEDLLDVLDLDRDDAPAPLTLHETEDPVDRTELSILIQEWAQGLGAKVADNMSSFDLAALYAMVSAWVAGDEVRIAALRGELDLFIAPTDDEDE